MKAWLVAVLLVAGVVGSWGAGAGEKSGAVEEAGLLAHIDGALSEAQAAMDALYRLKGYGSGPQKAKRKNNWEFIRFGR